MKTIYKINSETKDGVTVYGITAVTQLRDVFTDKSKATAFIEKCNSHNLSIIHFLDAVEDCIAQEQI